MKNFLKTAQHGTNARLVCMVLWGLQLVPLLGLSYECCKITQSSIKSILHIHFKKKEEREWHKRSNDRKYNIEVFPLLVEPMKNEDQLCMIENEFINYIPC